MKILVTGYNGKNRSFIAKELVRHLKECGHEVGGYFIEESWNDSKETIYAWEEVPNEYEHVKNEWIHMTPDNVTNPKDISYYDFVIHLGANSSTTETNVELIFRENFDFTLWLINKCQQYNVPLHYASSASVYGDLDHFQENGEMRPLNPYAFSKFMIDRIILKYKNTFKTPVIGFRYFNVYGNHAQEVHKKEQASVISKWDYATTNGFNFELFAGTQLCSRDFINIYDVCKIHEKLIEANPQESQILNIGTGEAKTFGYLSNLVFEKTGIEPYEIEFPQHLKGKYQKHTCADITSLKQIIGDYKFISLEEYFAEYF
jgi:ADP-L-glycero-D-manno-heptose 6-epimerase